MRLHEENMRMQKEIPTFLSYARHAGQPTYFTLDSFRLQVMRDKPKRADELE